ncbi:MAG: 50S ribosomal protein L25/general stress protein Ctc [Alphaproteobacteria bacterium]|nr:50S ribosomal protein L25/general stress protein Ctc [Alphaproteobacteria bacterium]
MAEFETISAEIRERAGKGAARAARRAGRVPAVIYGDNKDPVIVTVDRRDVIKQLQRGGIQTRLFDVKTDQGTHRTLIRDVHFDPVTDQPIHMDFLRVTRRTVLNVEVPVTFLNEDKCEGLTQGGMLQIVRNTVELTCPAVDIPDHLEIDLTPFNLGDSIHFSAVSNVPEGITAVIDDRDFTIATIIAPRGLLSAASEEEGETEGGEAAADEGGES